jgi:hypothetical protein
MGYEHCDILVGTNDCGARRLEPVTVGVRFPDGFCVEVGTLELTDPSGAVRACMRLSGGLGDRREPLVELTARLHFFAGSSSTRLSLTLRNPRRADHPGGIWELGSRGSVFLREVALTYAWPDPRAERTISA